MANEILSERDQTRFIQVWDQYYTFANRDKSMNPPPTPASCIRKPTDHVLAAKEFSIEMFSDVDEQKRYAMWHYEELRKK